MRVEADWGSMVVGLGVALVIIGVLYYMAGKS